MHRAEENGRQPSLVISSSSEQWAIPFLVTTLITAVSTSRTIHVMTGNGMHLLKIVTLKFIESLAAETM